ncbi:MAG: J domain-containing protein [Chloroflexi bacterium]|nr:J domain-containing protein [Chloroflexota bacterium]
MSERQRRFVGDPYRVLGVSRLADAREIRAAYRRVAKRLHPDVNPSPDAVAEMARLNAAYREALERARRETGRSYRGGAHSSTTRQGKVRWFVRQRPPPSGGRLVVRNRRVTLSGLRGENANVEALLVVENHGSGPIDGEVRALPAFVIVTPKHYVIEPGGAQMVRVSVPNHHCRLAATEAHLLFESNGGDEWATLIVPPMGEVLLSLEPLLVDLGEVAVGVTVQARMRVSYRGPGLPPVALGTDATWLDVRPSSLPRRTQYYRLTATPSMAGEHIAALTAHAGGARSQARVRLRAVDRSRLEGDDPSREGVQSDHRDRQRADEDP